jgi:uncharacterized protein
MNQQVTNNLNELMNRYMGLWNEPDAELRRKSITELWVEDGAQFTSQNEYHGYKALEGRVEAAYEQFVEKGGFVFRLAGDINAHHDAVKFNWEMVPAAGGEAAATGLIFLLLSDDGRIRFDYQF